ncbi:glycosyltransferase [bacterium]|nr:glycosyltransferase [bacterium]
MRILQVIAGAEHGGAETFFGDFMLAMHNCKNRPQNMVQKAVLRPYESRLGRLEKAGIPLATLPFGSWFDWRTRYGLRQEILDFKPHIVQTWMNRATKFVPPRSAVGMQPYVHVGWLGGYYDMKYYQSCDHIVVLTTDMQSHVLRSGWPKDRLHIVPPFAPDKNASPINRAEFDTPKDAPLIVTLGRLHVKKAQDILIRAMAPSRYEPFGVVTLEAWAQKCPLIAAASQGPKSVITHEHDGLVVPVDDVAALVDSIRTVLNDAGLRKKLIDNGRRTYDTKYSEKSVVDQYLSLYQDLALMGTYARNAA